MPLTHSPLFCALVLLTCAFPLVTTAASPNTAEAVQQLIAKANQGQPPVLWFATDPKINLGSGPKTWTAQSGGQFAVRGTDTWGNPSAAFGLAPDAKGGVAVTGSTTANLLKPQAGTVLFFCRAGEKAAPPMLLFSRADWGNPNYLSLRINTIDRLPELTLAVADPRAQHKPVQANFATLRPGAWTFVALTWQERAKGCHFRIWVGDLSQGQLISGELDTAPLAATPGILVLAGRRAETTANYATAPLRFADGLLHHFAIYDAALPEATVQSIFKTATRR